MRNNYVSSKVKLIKGNCGEGTYLIPYIKKTFGHENYYDILNTLRSNINYKDYFLKELFPVDVNNIITTDYIPLSFSPNEISGEFVVNEILCFLSFFRCFQKELNEFVNLRKDYEHHLFSGDYDLANNILLEIKETFGVSFWLLESQLLVANFSLSIVQAESFYQNLKSECNDYFIKSYVRSLRRKTNTFESAKDSLYFLDKKEKDFLSLDKKVSFEKQVYFSFNNHYYERIPDEKIWALLNMATKLNFIDMFILIERIIVYLLTDNNFSKTQLNKIIFAVSDYDLPLCCKKSCDQINNKIDWKDSITKIIYEYKKQLCSITKNNFKFVNGDKFCELPSSFDAVFYSTLINVLMSRECECSSLLRLIVNVIRASVIKKGDYYEFNKITNDSLRLQMLLNSTSMFWGYVDIYNQFFLGDVSYHTKHVIASCYYNREILLWFNMDNVLKQFNDNFGNYECNWFHNIELDGRMTYDSVTEKMCTIEHEKEALAEWHGLLSNHGSIISDILYNRCSEMLYISYLSSNSINKAIDLFVDLQFESKFKVGSFDNDLLIQKCNGIRLNGLYTNINFCIYAHLTNFRGASGLRFNNQAANSLMAILRAKGVDFPSQLFDYEKINKKKLAYIYRHICVSDLLKSRLIGYSIKTDDVVEQTKIAVKERKRLLVLAKKFDDVSERPEIDVQIETVDRELNSIDNFNLGDSMFLYAKLLKDAVDVSDVDIIFPFYKSLKDIVSGQVNCDFDNLNSGEFLLFRDSFVKFKKAYLKSLDEQIGINIRHGFLKNEIINFFSEKGIAFKKLPNKQSEVSYCVENRILKFRTSNEKSFLVGYVDDIIKFSKMLYDFIDDLLITIRIMHMSEETDNVFFVYIRDEEISSIAKELVNSDNPYNFKNILNEHMTLIIDSVLSSIGNYVEKAIEEKCSDLLDEIFKDACSFDERLNKTIHDIKFELSVLSKKIKKWFEFIKDGDELCSISKYFCSLKETKTNINYNLSDNLPNEITFFQLHGLDIILKNLIMNAEEHSGYEKNKLIINTSLSMDNNVMRIYFSNNLNKIVNADYILTRMNELERMLIKTRNAKFDNKSSGNGFYHIAYTLNTLVGSKWQLSFCKDELPEYFSLNITVDWGEFIV